MIASMETAAQEPSKVLIVEDDKFLLKAITRFIEQHGYITLKAENGLDALRIIKEEHPSLIISDLSMPVMDGFGLLEKLAFEAPQTPVIILSGAGDKPDIIQAFRAGAWDYVTKPIEDIDAFIGKIESTLMQAEMTYDYNGERELYIEEETGAAEQSGSNPRKSEDRNGTEKQELERIIDSLKQSVALINLDYSLARVNKPMAAMLKSAPSELIGSIRYLSTNGFSNKEQAIINFETVLAGEKVSGTFFDEERQSTYEVDFCPYYNSENTTVAGCVYVARDISSRNEEALH